MKMLRRGQSMVEILVAIGVMIIGITASSALMMATERSSADMMKEAGAIALAEEGSQAVISISDRSWADLTVGTHGLVIQASPAEWIFQGSSDVANGYTRVATVSTYDANTKKVVITVRWNPTAGRTATVENQLLLTDWSTL